MAVRSTGATTSSTRTAKGSRERAAAARLAEEEMSPGWTQSALATGLVQLIKVPSKKVSKRARGTEGCQQSWPGRVGGASASGRNTSGLHPGSGRSSRALRHLAPFSPQRHTPQLRMAKGSSLANRPDVASRSAFDARKLAPPLGTRERRSAVATVALYSPTDLRGALDRWDGLEDCRDWWNAQRASGLSLRPDRAAR